MGYAVNAVDTALGMTENGNIVKAYNTTSAETIAATNISANLKALDSAIGNRSYTQGAGYVLNGTTAADSITTALDKLNTEIGDRQYAYTTTTEDKGFLTSGQTITQSLGALNNASIKSTAIESDGFIKTTRVDGTSFNSTNAIHDYRVTGGSYNASAKAVDVTLTDKYGTATETATITGLDTSRVVAADSGTAQTLAGGTTTTIAGSETNVTGKTNIVTSVTGDGTNATVTVALGENVNVTNVTATNSVTAGTGTNQVVANSDGLKVGTGATLNSTALTIGTGTAATTLDAEKLTVGGKTFIDTTSDTAYINANSGKITNVADGEISSTSKDAVNGSQLYSRTNMTPAGNYYAENDSVTTAVSKIDTAAGRITTDGNIVKAYIRQARKRLQPQTFLRTLTRLTRR